MSNIKYTKEILEQVIRKSLSVSGVMRELGLKSLTGSSHAHLSRKIKEYGIDCSHFLGKKTNYGENHKGGIKRREANDILVIGSFRREQHSNLKRCMIEMEIKYECVVCKNSGLWLNSEIELEIDHINGNPLDNRIENLRFLCPNCHTQITKIQRKIRSLNRKIDKNILKEKKRESAKKNRQKIIDKKSICLKCTKEFSYNKKSGNHDRKYCNNCSRLLTRKTIRPNLETLLKEIEETNYSVVGRKYGVSDNAIRKWVKSMQKEKDASVIGTGIHQ